MIRTVALLGLVASTSVYCNDLWKAGFSATFGTFEALPRNSAAAQELGWKITTRPARQYSSGFDALQMLLPENDTTHGILIDENNQTAGMQIAIPCDQITSYYDMEDQGFTRWNYTNSTGDIVEYWTICFYFVSEDAAIRIASYNESELLRADNVVVEGIKGVQSKIATNLSYTDSIWIKQGCVPWMGQHYFFNMSTTLGCDDPFFPWFGLYDEDTKQLIGIGLVLAGSSFTSDKFESPTEQAVQFILPDRPTCLLELVENHGVTTFHVYFINHPRLIFC